MEAKTRKEKGVGWIVSAIGNAFWGGAKLADVLNSLGYRLTCEATPEWHQQA